MDRDFWNGRRVFLTGHTGFKGSWLSFWLGRLGAEVTGYALRPPTDPSLFEAAALSSDLRSVAGDIRDRSALASALAGAAPEIVIHMAAQTLVRYSYEHPEETFATNVMGTLNLYEAVRAAPSVRAVVNVTSDKCYENREWVWGYRESDPMGGFDPYAASKGCAELLTASYRRSFFDGEVALGSVRAGNVIGGGDWATDRLVPDLVRALLRGQPAQVRNPEAIRPWQHVLEPLTGYLMLARRLWTDGEEFAGGWNFGPERESEQPVRVMADRLVEQWGGAARWETPGASSGPHEARYLKLDSSKARALLGWAPRWSLDQALEATVAWHRAHALNEDVRGVMADQIDAYLGQAATAGTRRLTGEEAGRHGG